MAEYKDFQEIAHCGGKATFHIVCDEAGRRTYAGGVTHSRPVPAAWVGIYALLPHGIPVSDFQIGGIGSGFQPLPEPGWIPVLLGSDSLECWGHQCPLCQGYYRNRWHPSIYPLTCPYCGLRTNAYKFLTPGQKAYIGHYIQTLSESMDSEMEPGTEKEIIIDMDAIADLGAAEPKPDFYYRSETQQTQYTCPHCGDFNDIRGKFGYCVSCGIRNNEQTLKETFKTLREKLNNLRLDPEYTVRAAVSEFDACCRDLTSQIRKRIPMKPGRRAELERLIFHDVESDSVSMMRRMFDVHIIRGMSDDLAFFKMMMHRRHIFEHNGGVADERYIRESGDTGAHAGVLIRENQANAHRLIGCLSRMIKNFNEDFHEIFPPTQWPIDYHQKKQAPLRKS